jgi:hypothetical protein
MKRPLESPVLFAAALFVVCLCAASSLRAEDALFIGNSYTYGGPEMVINQHGGVPKLVEAIAASKGKKLSTLMLTVGGKDLAFHLLQPKTDVDIKAAKWDWVVLQGFSTEATHVGNPEEFFKDGEAFYRRILANSTKTKVVLFETWARPKGNDYYTGVSTPKTFVDVAQMNTEIQKNYTELYHRLEAIEPGNQVELAPVGLAFQRSLEKYPDVNLNFSDLHHANVAGSYLAALVIYATIYQESPKGATREFFGTSIDPGVAAKLQEIAEEVTAQKTP